MPVLYGPSIQSSVKVDLKAGDHRCIIQVCHPLRITVRETGAAIGCKTKVPFRATMAEEVTRQFYG